MKRVGSTNGAGTAGTRKGLRFVRGWHSWDHLYLDLFPTRPRRNSRASRQRWRMHAASGTLTNASARRPPAWKVVFLSRPQLFNGWAEVRKDSDETSRHPHRRAIIAVSRYTESVQSTPPELARLLPCTAWSLTGGGCFWSRTLPKKAWHLS